VAGLLAEVGGEVCSSSGPGVPAGAGGEAAGHPFAAGGGMMRFAVLDRRGQSEGGDHAGVGVMTCATRADQSQYAAHAAMGGTCRCRPVFWKGPPNAEIAMTAAGDRRKQLRRGLLLSTPDGPAVEDLHLQREPVLNLHHSPSLVATDMESRPPATSSVGGCDYGHLPLR
jgi:hypothetical protein